jgi:nucleotide-binding universal stress UspA family protein
MAKQEQAQPFRSVILATDFSPTVRVAGRYAALLAQRYDAELVVVHAFTLQQPALEAEASGQVHSGQRKHLEHLLSETLRELAPFAARAKSVLGQGSPIDVIDRVSKQHEQALIVLGTHGGGATERHVIGSVAEEILRTIHSPVLTVGPHVAMPSADKVVFRRILYATDFCLGSALAAAYAFVLAQTFGSDIEVLHVASEGGIGEDKRLAERGKEYLDALGELIPQHSEAFRSKTFVEFGKVRERVVKHAHEGGVDLIVLGAHHHSYLARHLRTGPAFHIILEAACPVLTVCDPEQSVRQQ